MFLPRVFAGVLSMTSAWAASTQCSQTMCVSLKQAGSNLEYTLQSKSSLSNTGWMGLGFGTHTIGTEMVVLWPNADGNVTLSRRKATQHAMPPVDQSPSTVATLSTSDTQISSSSNPVIAFTVPSTSASQVNIIWAFGQSRPSSSDPSATFTEHSDMGTYTLDVSTSSTGTNTTSTPQPTQTDTSANAQAWEPYQKKIVAHAVLVSVGFLVLLPSGALLGRLGRTFTPVWFQGHWILNLALTVPIIVAGVSLAAASMSEVSAQSAMTTHKTVGIVLCALYLVQVTLGGIIHFIKPRSQRMTGRRPPQNCFHAILGLTIIGLAFYQVRTGYKIELPNFAGIQAPKAIGVVWTVWVIVVAVAYGGGLSLLPRQWRQETMSRPSPQQEGLDRKVSDSE